MHEDEVLVEPFLVRELLTQQFPHWAELPIEPLKSSGTDNAIFRIGEKLLARFPRVNWAAGQVEKEWKWLPALATHLPVPISTQLAKGKPTDTYPWAWSVGTWLPGTNPTPADCDKRIARQLAEFVLAMQAIPTMDAPLASGVYERGVDLHIRDGITQTAIRELDTLGMIDAGAVLDAWQTALAAPTHQDAPTWLHGDLLPGNLLITESGLSAVIDFGCMGTGDPACDYLTAWSLFSPDIRQAYREYLQPSQAAWERGRGWALSVALLILPYYRETNPGLADIARYTIEQVLLDMRALASFYHQAL